jgi:hypothetical protein
MHLLGHICITRQYRLWRANYGLAPDKTNAAYWPNHLLPRRHTIHHLLIPYLMRVSNPERRELHADRAPVRAVNWLKPSTS